MNVNPIVVNNVYDISSSSGIYTFKFDGSFVDVNDNQTFTVNYTDINGVNSFHDFTFTKIKSLNIPSPLYSQVKPNPASITAPRCQSQNFNIYFNNVQFSNSALSTPIAYGTITDYEYLLPKGWMLNGQTATGTNWLPGKNNVSVTSDLSNGDNTYIQIRAVNPCGANLIKGHNSDIGLIKVSRPAPTLSITGNSFNLCNATTGAYTINGIPPGATVLWQIDNTTLAQINGPNNTNTINVTANSNGFNGDVVLTATVQQCTFTYPVTATITIGTGTPPTITNLNYDNRCGSFAEAYCNNPPNSTGFIWSFNFGQIIQNNPGYYGNYFKIQPIPNQSTPGNTYYDYLSVQATNNCGVSAASATSSFTVGPIAANCGSGGGKGYLSTAPVIGQPLAETKAYTNNNVRVFPNPVKASLSIQLPDSIHLSNTFITITNLDGRRIITLHPNSLSPLISTTHWAAGIYLVTIYEGTKKIAVQQVLKYE
ncbi:T9SS type A sorting domain-containing protein [Hydrotalea lipotrueae]|uniref:T9SS type A sorting domain-containing protein n=1 Tax=Hydrotalea lipotrueae TaxID=2803817 RepID=UPI001C477E02|nr:T9SS type A sorting domain-containing protein [Hydrotalea lipotrueae]